jgi:YVTN family beta-propeller protein
MNRYFVAATTVTALLFGARALAQVDDEDTATNVGTVLNFETPLVHPIATSFDGKKLFVVDTPDARLSIFDTISAANPVLVNEIPVGIEPVSVRQRTSDELWVVNHTSDSISVVSVSLGMVTDTIQVKDEPSDVVFAGSPQRAYVSVSESQQVRVFDVATHALLATIPILGIQPRALAVSADGLHVYAAVALSGNKTTVIPPQLAPDPPAPTNPNLGPPPKTALIVAANDPAWSNVIQYTMPDNDVAEIATATNVVTRYFHGVGTGLWNLAVQPGTGDLFVANTDARNLVRFEPNLRGHAVDNQITKVAIGTGLVTKMDLNPGVDYAVLPNPTAKSQALAQPTDVVFDATGSTMYVAAFGTDRVARMSPSGAILARIEIGPAVGATVDPKNKRGPRALAMHPTGTRLYVMNRIANTISVVNTATNAVTLELAIGAFDPTPPATRLGRGFLYDAKLSGNGTMSCASCHFDAESDREDWDLGDPEGEPEDIADPSNVYGMIAMHPMKGPMQTQTLRGLAGNTPLHWRGDRSSFTAFNSAFSKLMGGPQLTTSDMDAFSAFMMQVVFEPNPHMNLDRTLPATIHGGNPTVGKDIYKNGSAATPIGSCNSCHHLPLGTGNKIVNKTVLGQPQGMKVPQLRTTYKRMQFDNSPGAVSLDGFGFGHDGSFPTVEAFLSNPVTFGTLATQPAQQRDLAAFLMCIDTGTPPAVGYSRTVASSSATSSAVAADVALLTGLAALGDIDLIAKGRTDGVLHGFKYVPASGRFQSDQAGYGPFTWTELKTKLLAGGTLTLMGVPYGAGQRMGIDRNMNGVPDAEDNHIFQLENFGSPSPACAGDIHLTTNSEPLTGNSTFAFMCTGLTPNANSWLVLTYGEGLEPALNLYGMKFWTDITGPFVLLNMPADDLGFGFLKIPIPASVPYLDIPFSAMAVTLHPCGTYGLAGSQGTRFSVSDP